jgi:D-beta-D-heptose 7-phosphate kinase/D-beta-D-heptose 1-phosphate adenosyltransferase
MVKQLSNIFNQLKEIRVLLLGDFMLDQYTKGSVSRISPEAPVPVLKVEAEEASPGGAGNVALNLLALGASVITVGRRGNDEAGRVLLSFLQRAGADVHHLFIEEDYLTPIKNRLIAASQQLLRLDREKNVALGAVLEKKVMAKIPQLLETIHVVALSDYGKGFLSSSLIEKVIREAREKNIPVVVDPKGIDFSKYAGATLIKPNLSEAYAAAKLSLSEPLEKVADILLEVTQAELLMVTRSEKGISCFDRKKKRFDFPVKSKEVKDVTGAGDTVLAMVVFSIANQLEMSDAVHLANIAAGISVEHVGCVSISLCDVARRMLELHGENKIFDEDHLFALRQVLLGRKVTLLGVDSTCGMSTLLFQKIRELSSREQRELMIYIKDSKPDMHFVQLLSSLSEVDFIILQRESLQHLCKSIEPDEVFEMEGDKMVALENAKDLLRSLSKSSKLR